MAGRLAIRYHVGGAAHLLIQRWHRAHADKVILQGPEIVQRPLLARLPVVDAGKRQRNNHKDCNARANRDQEHGIRQETPGFSRNSNGAACTGFAGDPRFVPKELVLGAQVPDGDTGNAIVLEERLFLD